MNPNQFATVFPLGSHLCRQPMPALPELKRDMETLKRNGFNLVKLQTHWAYDESLEGQYDFSPYEELIEHAARLDLGVYLGLTCEQAPAWLWRKHPDARMIRRDGVPVAYEAQMTLPADGKPGPCFDHAGAMHDQLRFIRNLVETLGRFENVVVWNTWQEIAYWSERFAGDHVCYCEHTLAHFRRWLQARYGDLDSLNRAWRTHYGDWQSVSPDRSAARGAEALPQDIAFRTFMDNAQIAHVLASRAQAIKDADPLKRPVFAHKGGPIIGSGMDWTYARAQDFLSSSAYPAWFPTHEWDDARPERGQPFDRHEALLTEMWDGLALRFDHIRSANRRSSPMWAAEFQGGPVSTNFHKGRMPSPADMRRWMLTAVASGVSGISFWVTRAEIAAAEMNGFSLLDSAGDDTPRLSEAARIGKALNAHADVFAQATWPQAPAAIVLDENNYQFCASLIPGGEHLAYSVRGWHRLLWDAGIAVDFIEASQLDEPFINDYEALILPFPLAMSEAVAGKLTRYVERGGHLICEAAPGRIDENGYANRGEMSPAMRALFGVWQTGFTLVREPAAARSPRWLPQERTWGEFLDAATLDGVGILSGHSLRANVYVQTFACEGSEPILQTAGQIAGVMRRMGDGAAWLMGTYAGHGGTAHRDADSARCILALLAACGISPQRAGKLLLRKRVTPRKEAWFFTNPTGHAVTARGDVAGWAMVEDMLGEPLQRAGDEVELTVQSLDVRVLIVQR